MLHHAIPRLMPFAGSRLDRLANGNRLTKIEGASSTSYTYTAGTNRLATATGSEPGTYGYDSNGNTTSDGTHAYQYSQRDRLGTADSGTTGTYSYDGDGRRVKKVAGGVTTLYFYDNDGKLLEEYVPATGAGKDYVWLPGTYEPLARVDFAMADADNGNVLRATKSSPNVHLDWSLDGTSGPFVLKRSLSFTFSNPVYLGPAQTTKTFDDAVLTNTTSYAYETFRRTLTDTLYFYHADHLGTPSAMTNSAGTLVWRAEHTPFGGIYALTVGTITNNLRFPGQYYDGETGLAQNWFRDYKHNTGRYWEPDSLPFGRVRAARNLCRPTPSRPLSLYAKFNPIDTVDFQGLFELKGFPAAGLSVDASVYNAIRGLRKCCNCPMCADAANKLLHATIHYSATLEACGATWPFIDPNGFTVGPGILPGGSCCAAQTFAEESLHLAGASDSNNEAGSYAARCAPCR